MILRKMMLVMKLLFVVTCLISSVFSKDDVRGPEVVPFNLTHLVLQSALYCGPSFLCDQSLLPRIRGVPGATGSRFSSCGWCSCNDQCYERDNCCPDVYFRYGNMVCNDLLLVGNYTPGTLHSGNGQMERHFYALIETCPTEANNTLAENCHKERSKLELMQNPPVSSRVTRRTYKNQHCALCNNAKDLIPWELMFECPQAIDFNYLSSYQEILEVAETKRCKVPFSPSGLFFQKCPLSNENIISSCNISGSWHRYDPSIEHACISGYYAVIGIFKNIFCAMCNPPSIDPSRSRYECKNRDSVYHTPCVELPSIEASFPYKNHYCLMCNHGNDTEPINDISLIQAKEVYDRRNFHPLTITINFNFKDNRLKEHIDQLVETFNTSNRVPSILDMPVNVSNLIRTSFALSGTGVCMTSLLPNYTATLQTSCSCEIGCRHDCCDDFALKQPWACINEFDHRRNTSSFSFVNYLMIAGCVERHIIDHWCASRNLSDFYQLLPVTERFGDGTTYANIFCYLCNNKKVDYLSLHRFKYEAAVWGLIVECKTFINYRYFNSMQNFINFAQINECDLKFEPHQRAEKCEGISPITRPYISKCNEFGSWTSTDDDVKYACEDIKDYIFPKVKANNIVYRNKFCLACNPMKVEPSGVDSCTLPHVTRTATYKACREFPDTHGCSNFRNVFCQMCNGIYDNCFRIIGDALPSTFPPTIFPTIVPTGPPGFRSLFSMMDYSEQSTKATTTSCSADQLHDEYYDNCLPIQCYPGKVLKNGSCLSLLRKTTNLRYTMAVKIDYTLFTSFNVSLYSYMTEFRKWYIEDLKRHLGNGFYVEDVILMSSANCESRATDSREIHLYLKMFVDTSFDRDYLENQLLMYTNHSRKVIKYVYEIWQLQITENQIAIFLPSLVWKLNTENNCLLLPNEVNHGVPVFRNVMVSSVLTCRQLIVKNNAFGVSWENIRLNFSLKDISLNFNKFQRVDSDGIRICVQDISYYVEKFRVVNRYQNGVSSLTVLTLVCIGVSLICLLLTFITYASFRSLRTVPGLNNMFLIFSLFFAQLMLIIRPFSNIEDFSIEATFVSALTHFFWLSTFFWLQICSFHMCLVFTSKAGIETRKGFKTKTIVKYSAYGFGVSATMVTANIVTSLISTSGVTTGYDKTSTLMTFRTAFIVTLLSPLIFVCVTNIIFYILTIYKIISVPHIESTSGNRTHFSVYIRLFSLTGLSWILQIVDTFLEMSALSYLIAVLNGLQGLFIFLSYVCNTRVLKMWLKVCSVSPAKSSQYSTRSGQYETATL